VAIAGDTVLVRDRVLYVNGEPFQNILDKRYGKTDPDYPIIKHDSVKHPWLGGAPKKFGPHVVGADAVFMMGDNRDNSSDSRVYSHGDVPLARLKARAMVIYFSLNAEVPWWNLADKIRWDRIGKLIY
jgi:signal peptidase I